MIVLLDTKTFTIKIYTESGMKSISFDQVDLLKDIFKKNKIIYVTSVMVTDAESVIQTVNALSQQRSESLKKAGEPMFLRSTLPGHLNIPGVRNKNTNREEELSFQGPFDGKQVDDMIRDYGKDIFNINANLRKLLKSGKLQILGESEFEDQRERFKSGELQIRNLSSEYIKYMKLMSKEESEEVSVFGVKSTGPTTGGANPNEGTAVLSTMDRFFDTRRGSL